jgi:3-oxoacyl-[acyl-carrier-protein] synthase III
MAQETFVRRVRISGTGSYAPERVVTNDELAGKVGTSDEWVRSKLGIRERRVAAVDQSTSDLAVQAGTRALENAGVDASELDMIILATATPDRMAPATAPKVQHRIGARNAAAFDVNAVCAGFIYGLTVGAQFVGTGMSHKVLVIGADTFSRITDWSRRDCVFFGDGAGAVVLSQTDDESGFLCSRLYADGGGYEAFTVPAGGSELPASPETLASGLHTYRMDGHLVYETAIQVIPSALRSVLSKSGLQPADVDHVIPHQPSIRILEESARRLEIPFEKFHTNMDRYANTSSATIPLLLDEVNRSGAIKPGEIVGFVAVGAGWAWGASILRW